MVTTLKRKKEARPAVAGRAASGAARGRRVFLSLLLGSIAVNAALGIYALVVPDFGELQGKILATSACVTGAGVLSLTCLPAWERGRLGLVPVAGIAVSVAGFALLAAGIWAETGTEPVWKTAGTLLLLGGAAGLPSLLALTRLAPRFRWAFPIALSLIGVLAGLTVSVVWGEWEAEWFGRMTGVVAVLVAAFTIAIPLLHRASRRELAAVTGLAGVRVEFCPSCGRRISVAAAEDVACPACGARFTVRFLA